MIATPVKLRLMVSALLLAGGLSACSANADDYSAEDAEQLQAQVLTITETAPTDPATALTQLDGLAAQADDALSRGAVTEQRHTDIVEAIALVRGDLEAAVTEQQTPAETTDTPSAEPTSTPTEDSGNSDEDESENDESDGDESNTDESEDDSSEEPAPAPTEEATTPANPGNNGNGNTGNSGNSGNGNSSDSGGPGTPAEPVTPEKPAKTPKPGKED